MDYTSKIAIITGAASGIGLGISTKLLEKGAKVLLTDVNLSAVESAYEELKKHGDRVNYAKFSCDVTSTDRLKEMFTVCENSLGKPNILVNNAGSENECNFNRTVQLLLEAPVNGTEIALEYMGKHRGGQGGNVVNVASIAGINPFPMIVFYSTAKSGLVSYTKNIGHPFHSNHTGVTVQCLCPAAVDTDLLNHRNFNKEKERDERCHNAFNEVALNKPRMTTEEVACATLKLMEDGKPGAALVIEKGKDSYYA